jgi:hypothetical protein
MKLQLIFGRDGLAYEDYIVFGICMVVFEFNIGLVLTARRYK